MKTSSASKRVMNQLRKMKKLSPIKPLPSEGQIDKIARKIIADEPVTENDMAAVMAILKRFSNSARVVRALAKANQKGTAFALTHLLNVTIANVRCLDGLPIGKLQHLAAPLTAFPMLVSLRRTSQKLINKRVAEMGLGSDVAPGYTVNSRWKKDDFAMIAEELLVEVFQGAPPSLSLDQWTKVWPALREVVDVYLKEWPSVFEDLKLQVTTSSDTNPGRRKARVIDNIRRSMRALVGLKGLR